MKTIAEGYTKVILEAENPGQIIMRFKDTASAYHAIKRATIAGKGLTPTASRHGFSVCSPTRVLRIISSNFCLIMSNFAKKPTCCRCV